MGPELSDSTHRHCTLPIWDRRCACLHVPAGESLNLPISLCTCSTTISAKITAIWIQLPWHFSVFLHQQGCKYCLLVFAFWIIVFCIHRHEGHCTTKWLWKCWGLSTSIMRRSGSSGMSSFLVARWDIADMQVCHMHFHNLLQSDSNLESARASWHLSTFIVLSAFLGVRSCPTIQTPTEVKMPMTRHLSCLSSSQMTCYSNLLPRTGCSITCCTLSY